MALPGIGQKLNELIFPSCKDPKPYMLDEFISEMSVKPQQITL